MNTKDIASKTEKYIMYDKQKLATEYVLCWHHQNLFTNKNILLLEIVKDPLKANLYTSLGESI